MNVIDYCRDAYGSGRYVNRLETFQNSVHKIFAKHFTQSTYSTASQQPWNFYRCRIVEFRMRSCMIFHRIIHDRDLQTAIYRELSSILRSQRIYRDDVHRDNLQFVFPDSNYFIITFAIFGYTMHNIIYIYHFLGTARGRNSAKIFDKCREN